MRRGIEMSRRKKRKLKVQGVSGSRSIVHIGTKTIAKPSCPTVDDIPKADEFMPIGTVTGQPGVGDVMVGSDLRLYRRAKGVLDLIVPCEPRDKTTPVVWFGSVDKTKWPPMGQLAYLFDKFLSKYSREVMYVVGELHDGSGFLFMVPDQLGDSGSIEWADPEGMDWFATRAKFIGTAHIHPGESCSPSTTDVDDWKEPVKSGVHIVFGRNGDYTVSASIAGHVLRCDKGNIKDVTRVPTSLYLPPGRTLEDSLEIKVPVKAPPKELFLNQYRNGQTLNRWNGPDDDDDIIGYGNGTPNGVADALLMAGAHPYPTGENGCFPVLLRMVQYGNHSWLMTEDGYAYYLDLLCECTGYQAVDNAPAGRIVVVTGIRGGK